MDIKRVDDAIVHFREALRLSPKRFEAHHGLIGCYLTERRMREAIAQAKDAFGSLGQSARSLTLYGTVLAKEPLTVEKAKSYLERALRVAKVHRERRLPGAASRPQGWDQEVEWEVCLLDRGRVRLT